MLLSLRWCKIINECAAVHKSPESARKDGALWWREGFGRLFPMGGQAFLPAFRIADKNVCDTFTPPSILKRFLIRVESVCISMDGAFGV
jgi:hypothetical protein